MVLHKEVAFNCLVALGYLGKVEFVAARSENSEFRQEQNQMVERCLRLQNIINRFANEMSKLGLKMLHHPDVDENFRPNTSDVSEVENAVMQLHEELDETLTSCNELENLRDTLFEKRGVLLQAQNFITIANNSELREKDGTTEFGWSNFITGCIPVKNFAAFELMVWRVSRDQVLMYHEEYELEKTTDSPVVSRYKYIFIIACVTDGICSKLMKVCSGFGVKLYACPLLPSERQELLESYNTEISDLEEKYTLTLERKRHILEACVAHLQIWHTKINRILTVYTGLTHFSAVLDEDDDSETKYIEAICWIPRKVIDTVRNILRTSAQSDIIAKTEFIMFPVILNEIHNQDRLKPPTLLHTNEFTRGFQSLINAYGYASYREINPGPISIVTFSFFFAAMLADVGHGLIIVIIALSLMFYNPKFMKSKQYQKQEYEILRFLMTGRYVILLMGICSVYTGLIYNRFFSKTMNIFGSAWTISHSVLIKAITNRSEVNSHNAVIFQIELDPANAKRFGGYPYTLGLDPIWGTLAKNDMQINNSLRIKVAIIYGIVNLFAGLTISVFNAVYFGDKFNIFLIILPKFVFICCVFLYILVLIMYKWFMFGGYHLRDRSPACAPSLLSIVLHMFLFMEPSELEVGCPRYMYKNQGKDRLILTPLALCSVIVLLCGYPIRTIIENAKAQRWEWKSPKVDFMSRVEKAKIFFPLNIHQKREKELPFKYQLSDIIVNQVFITFETLMGSVLHVASFLRMWALSMVHSQISSFVWQITLRWAFKIDHSFLNSIFICGGFAVFAVVTIVYLVIMEGVGIFIEAVRLQFYDFQFLFFKSDGYPFSPFHFKPFNDIEMELEMQMERQG